jgi:hypothetical protein
VSTCEDDSEKSDKRRLITSRRIEPRRNGHPGVGTSDTESTTSESERSIADLEYSVSTLGRTRTLEVAVDV